MTEPQRPQWAAADGATTEDQAWSWQFVALLGVLMGGSPGEAQGEEMGGVGRGQGCWR